MKLFFLFCITTLFADTAYFQPPIGWQMADPSTLSPHVQVLFMGKAENNFSPTINLATEEVEVNLKEYFKSVKEFHKSNPEETWRDLGKFTFQCGEGKLTEITSPSPAGEIKMLQAIFVKDKIAYCITAAALKSDFPKHQSQIIQSIRSLKLVSDLFSEILEPDKRSEIESFFAKLGKTEEPLQTEQWQDWQKLLESNHSRMGEYWHYLALRQGWAKIHGHQ